jgi:hypothetical protein
MDLQAKIADIIYTHVSSMVEVNGIEDAADAVVAVLPDHAARVTELEARVTELETALLTTRALVCEGAIVGFNWADGDWSDRLYANNGNISHVLGDVGRRSL